MTDTTADKLAEALRSLAGMAEAFPSELHKAHPDVTAARDALAAYDAERATAAREPEPDCPHSWADGCDCFAPARDEAVAPLGYEDTDDEEVYVCQAGALFRAFFGTQTKR